jgi:hypothetical protein
MATISLTDAQMEDIFGQCTNELELINANDLMLVQELAARLKLKRITTPHPNEEEYYDDGKMIVLGTLEHRVEFLFGSCGDLQQIGAF